MHHIILNTYHRGKYINTKVRSPFSKLKCGLAEPILVLGMPSAYPA